MAQPLATATARCSKGHLMVEWPSTDTSLPGLHKCAQCGDPSKAGETGLCCTECCASPTNHSATNNNSNNMTSSSSSPSSSYSKCIGCLCAATCKNGHAMVKAEIGQQGSCDVCGGFTAPIATQMVCFQCDYVHCHRCIIGSAIAAAAAPMAPASASTAAGSSSPHVNRNSFHAAGGVANNNTNNNGNHHISTISTTILESGSASNYNNHSASAPPAPPLSAPTQAQASSAEYPPGGLIVQPTVNSYGLNWDASAHFTATGGGGGGPIAGEVLAVNAREAEYGAGGGEEVHLHWYKATAGVGGVFFTEMDCSWLLQRPTRQIYFQDGLLADVTSAMGTRLEIAQSSTTIATKDEIYFTLPEWFPTADRAMTEMLQYSPFPERFVSGAKLGEQGSGGNAFGFATEGSMHSFEGWDSKPYRSTGGSGGTCDIIGDGDWTFKLLSLLSTVLLTGVGVAALWINLIICKAIGDVAKWPMVFLWLFLGLLGYCAVFAVIAYLIPRFAVAGGGRRGRDNNPICKSTTLTILLFVWCASFGAPAAWTASQQASGRNYLDQNKTKFLNCWRNPYERFDMIEDHFVVFEEAEWIVDYKLRYNQGVSTLQGTDNNGGDDGARYNYCVAPMAYRGLPHCPQTFFAACFRETTGSILSSCDDADATTCGWNYPSPGNIFRMMNRNEQFWSEVEEEDETHWRNAATFATSQQSQLDPSIAPVTSVIGFYSGEGPYEIQTLVEASEDLEWALLVSALVSFAGVAFVLIFFGNKCND